MNHKKLNRLYCEEGLTVRRRRGRNRATGTRAPITLPQGPSQRWSLDFVAEVLSWGRRFQVLAIVDDFTREALALVVDTSIGGRRVVRELDALIAPARPTGDDRHRQRHRADLAGRAGMDQPDWHPVALHHAWQANPERLRGELHR